MSSRTIGLHWTARWRAGYISGIQWLAASEVERSPVMRAERAKLKSQRDDMIIAPGKQSAARGYGRKMISSFFPSGLARLRRAKPEGKKEAGWEGSLPRAAASTLRLISNRRFQISKGKDQGESLQRVLTWAIIMPPLAASCLRSATAR